VLLLPLQRNASSVLRAMREEREREERERGREVWSRTVGKKRQGS
jgi:hypothetical protein